MTNIERLSTNERGSSKFHEAGAATLAVLAISVLPHATAEANEFNVPDTGGGMPGVGFVPGELVPYPASTPGVQDMHLSVMNGSGALNARVAATPGMDQANGFSQGAVVVHESLSNPTVAAGVSEATLVGDPCSPTGIMTMSSEARQVANMTCAPIASSVEQTVIRNNQDPIANFHYPTNLVDAANMLAGYEVAHTYNLPRTSYDVEVNDTGRVTYIDMIMHDSALKVALGRRGIFLAPDQEQFIKDSIPYGFGPNGHTEQPDAIRKDVSAPVALASETLPPAPVEALPPQPPASEPAPADTYTEPVADSVNNQVDYTATAITDVAPQFKPQVDAVVADIHRSVDSLQQQANGLLGNLLPQPR